MLSSPRATASQQTIQNIVMATVEFFFFFFGLICNRPFYRNGGQIELIRFKEYYRMPKGHEQISFVFSSTFRDIIS